MSLQRAKGTRDFLPEEKINRNAVVQALQQIFERYGFNPLETPLLERLDLLSAKYAGGEEILKEIFTLRDQGDRKLGLRYDLTVPMTRFVAMNKGLRMPFKRYQIDRVFRDGPLKAGRYREFWQCDVDVVGCASVSAELELLNIACDVFKALDLEVTIKINDRQLLDAILAACDVPTGKNISTILVLDKLEKVGKTAVAKELQDAVGLSEDIIDKLFAVVLAEGSNEEKLTVVQKTIDNADALANIRTLLDNVDGLVFSPSLARGLAYYTGPIFEVFSAEDLGITSSLAGGGRYDNMIGNFIGDNGNYPATGISFGLDVIHDIIQKKRGMEKKTVVQVYVISIGCFEEAYALVQKLRFGGLNVDIDLLERGVSKNLTYASNVGIPYVVLLGKKELAANKVTLRDMKTGKEQLHTVNECFTQLIEK